MSGIGVRNLCVSLGGRPVLHGVDFSVPSGQMAALCGPNGAGKSTLLRALAGLLPQGPRPNPKEVAYVEQGARCSWALTVRQVAALGRIPHRDNAAAPVERALALCGVAGLAEARIDRLSGGQARRAMLARAFATDPQMFLLDEPIADLDPAASHEIMGLLRATARSGRAVVVVLHALDLAMRYADRIAVMAGGRLVADGPAGAALAPAARAFGLRYGVDPAPRLLAP